MRRQNNHSPVSRCICNNGQKDSLYKGNRKLNVVETCTIEDDCCCKCKHKNQQLRHSSFQGDNTHIDEETLRALCALRQKACKFINSETEYTNTSGSVSGTNKNRPCQNQTNDEKYLIRIEDLLEYSPQSEFLKKLKKHYQNIPNDQTNQSIFNEKNEFISNSLEYNEDPKKIANFSMKESTKECRCCSCIKKEKLIEKTSKPIQSEKLKKKTSIGNKNKTTQEQRKEIFHDEYSPKNSSYKKIQKKSQHVSRLRKIVKHRGRRRKKSRDSEKHSSQEPFEPTLKRPHENSCERCWRYASPSRSPVNKPDQRYNPNFRRAHSWQDFSSVKESASEYVNSEILDKNTGPIKIEKELTKDFDFPSAQKRHPLNKYTSTRVKEFEIQSSPRQTSGKNYQNAMSAEEVKKSPTSQHQPQLLSKREKKPRPKSYTPGESPRNLENMSSFYENLNSTEYMKIHSRKTSPKGLSSSRSMKSIVNNKLPPNDASVYEKCFQKNKTKSFLRKGKHESQDAEWIPQQEFVSVDFSKPSHCIPNVQTSPKGMPSINIDTAQTPHSKATTYRPSSKYFESEGSHKIYSQKIVSPKNNIYTEVPVNAQYFPNEISQYSKSQSSQSFQSKYVSSRDRQLPLGSYDSRYTSKNISNQANQNEAENQFVKHHEMRPCNCAQDKFQRPLPTKRRDYTYNNENKKKDYCCHCRRRNSSPKNYYPQSLQYQDRTYDEVLPSEEVNEFIEKYSERIAFKPCQCNEWKETVEYNKSERPRAKVVPCPYKATKPRNDVEQDYEYPENPNYYYSKENHSYPVYEEAPTKNSFYRRGQSNFNKYVPTNYCVFYMKKNKENKEDEVEVLVEELTEQSRRCTEKDCRSRAIEDKMKKILENREDSMALRFQKGVSEVTRDPESSRTLYF